MEFSSHARPPPFYQLFTIHSLKINRKIPLIWAFADGKTTAHYRKIFQIVKSKIGSLPKLFPVLKGQYLRLWKRNLHTVLTKGATFISPKQFIGKSKNWGSVFRTTTKDCVYFFNGDPFFCSPPPSENCDLILHLCNTEIARNVFQDYSVLADLMRYFYSTWILSYSPPRNVELLQSRKFPENHQFL